MNPVPGRFLRITCLICALFCVGLIWYLSDQPFIEITSVFRHQDKLMHVFAFCVLAIFSVGALRQHLYSYCSWQLVLVTLAVGLYGLLDEYHQSFVPGRHASAFDVMADITGAVLGAALLFLLVRIRRQGGSHIQ